jgi:hypothetical protein
MWPFSSSVVVPPPSPQLKEEILKNAASMVIAAIVCYLLWHLATVLTKIAEGAAKVFVLLIHFIMGVGKLLTGATIVVLVAALIWIYQSATPWAISETLFKWYNVLLRGVLDVQQQQP